MARQVFLGQTLKRLRNERGLTQVKMAKALGISPSYLNLIEHNRRSLTPALRARLVEDFGLELDSLSGAREARLRDELAEVFGDPLFLGRVLSDVRFVELVASAPEFCHAIVSLYQAYRSLKTDHETLSERLTDDPYLSETSHQLLTLLTSVRSFAEILQDNAGLSEDKRRDFAGVLVAESERLTELVRGLFEFIGDGGLGSATAADLPRDEVNETLQSEGNYFPALEDAAEDLRREVLGGGDEPNLTFDVLVRFAKARFGLAVTLGETAAPPDGSAGDGLTGDGLTGDGLSGDIMADPERGLAASLWRFDRKAGAIFFDNSLAPASRRFQLARLLALEAEPALVETLLSEAGLSSLQAEDLYRYGLGGYLAAALLMPYAAFREAAIACRYDIDRLARRFGGSFEQVAHRLTTLQRPGAEGIPFHLVTADVAGNILKRFSASGLTLPRFGGLCPRWVLHEAFATPDRVCRQLVELPDAARFLFIAKAIPRPGRGYGDRGGSVSVMLGCDTTYGKLTVYGDDLVFDGPAGYRPIGLNCRHCPRPDCRQRALPWVGAGPAGHSHGVTDKGAPR